MIAPDRAFETARLQITPALRSAQSLVSTDHKTAAMPALAISVLTAALLEPYGGRIAIAFLPVAE